MGLEDFEKGLAENQERGSSSKSHDRSRDRSREHRHRHKHHRSSRHDEEDGSRHRHRHHRSRRQDDEDEGERPSKRRRNESPAPAKPDLQVFDEPAEDEEDDWVEKGAETAPPVENNLDSRDRDLKDSHVQRDSWMQAPSAIDIDYVSRQKPKLPPSQFVSAKESHEFKVQKTEVKSHLADLEADFASDGEEETSPKVEDEPAQHEVAYTFSDSGSSWRMTKLNAVYRKAKESNIPVDEVALERYGDLRDFDDAREEERELDRRKMYGNQYVGLEKPSGELFQERKMKAGLRREAMDREEQAARDLPQGETMEEQAAPVRTVPLDQTALNKLKAQMMKAKLRKAPNAAQLEAEYELAANASHANAGQADVIVLNQMENRMLAGDRSGEVVAAGTGKRARERGTVVENEDMSIEDMVRHEKRTRGVNGGEGRAFAERIAKDSKFENDLDYMDENSEKLSKKVAKSEINLRNTAVGDFQRMNKILESCPLCYHEDTSQPPQAPVISLATRTYMTLATEPELSKGGAVIVPIQHRLNLLECDDDEWEEIRNFMKSLTRMYHDQDKAVIFYENAAHMSSRKGHAALFAVPLPEHLGENAPAFFKEAILASDEQWSQHKPIIDTLALSQRAGYGKQAFRRAMVKEMPYFHVFFSMDGGLGHVIEDERRWPKGDLFAREVVGGMLDRAPDVIKRQGRWARADPRIEGFRRRWNKFDWTRVLMDGGQ